MHISEYLAWEEIEKEDVTDTYYLEIFEKVKQLIRLDSPDVTFEGVEPLPHGKYGLKFDLAGVTFFVKYDEEDGTLGFKTTGSNYVWYSSYIAGNAYGLRVLLHDAQEELARTQRQAEVYALAPTCKHAGMHQFVNFENVTVVEVRPTGLMFLLRDETATFRFLVGTADVVNFLTVLMEGGIFTGKSLVVSNSVFNDVLYRTTYFYKDQSIQIHGHRVTDNVEKAFYQFLIELKAYYTELKAWADHFAIEFDVTAFDAVSFLDSEF